MSFRTRTSSGVKPPPPSRMQKMFSFDPYPPRRTTTCNRTINYRDPDSDSDDEVIYVGQRLKSSSRHVVPIPKLQPQFPQIILGEEVEYFVKPTTETTVVKQQRAAEVVVQHNNYCRAVFQILPYEIHQNIAKYFEADSDVSTYAKLCRQARDSISSSVWRERFARTFDIPEGDFEPLALAKKYAYRRDVPGWICFDLKKWGGISQEAKTIQESNTEKCLSVLKDLIVDSNARKGTDAAGNQVIIGLNHDYIRAWVAHGSRKYTDIIDAVLNTDSTSWDEGDIVSATTDGSLVLVIQLCLTSLSLHPKCCNSTLSHFDMSQREAYTDYKKQPVFVGGWKQDINVRWLLHTVNFFKLHLKASSGEGLLGQHYGELEHDQLPQPWLGRIKEGTQPIGSHWKSAYTFMKDNSTLAKLRVQGNEYEFMVDDGELFSDMTIFFDDSKFSTENWPKAFEALIKSNPYSTSSPPRSRQTRSASAIMNKKYELNAFYGTSRGASQPSHFYGRIHGLPEQQGIPGFQRISLIKFFPLDGEYDPGQVWAYEGCVLPGGRIIVGRWWDLTADPRNPVGIFGGPFIWWNVDKSAAEPPISSEEALEFLDSIHDPNMGFA